MYEVIFDRNGAKAYVKNVLVLFQRKIRETWFYEITPGPLSGMYV